MIRFLILTLSLTVISGCSTTIPITKKSHSTDSDVSVVNLKALSSLDQISNKLAKHRTVFVGETHTSYSDHLNQLAVIKNLHQQWGKNTSIGLEMIQTPYQSFLDSYVAGTLSEKDMLRGTQWYERWRYDFRLYRPIFEYSKQHKIPLIALNIPKELTKRITKVGINKLSKKERMQLPTIIDRSNKAYIKRIKSVFGRHSHTSSKGFDKFLDAQLGWDEGMAFSAANYLKKYPHKRMIILAGGGHIVNYQGIPDRLDRQIKSKSAVVLNNTYENIRNSGDYLLLSLDEKLPNKIKLGIAMEETKNATGIKVTKVLPHSSAQKAGLKVGDLIIKMDKQKIGDTIDLKLFLEEAKAGNEIVIQILRKDHIVDLKAVLKSKLSAMSLHSP